MSATKRKRRGRGQSDSTQSPAPANQPAAQSAPPIPRYRWKQFPVYFAFWVGAFVGLYAGILSQASDNVTFQTVVFVIIAFFLGLGLSRLVVVWMMEHQWVKPRAKRR